MLLTFLVSCLLFFISVPSNNLLLRIFFSQLVFFMFLLNHVFHIVLTFLSLTVPLDYFSQTIFHFFILCFKQRWTAACVVVHKVANHKFIWVQNAISELTISKKRPMMTKFFFFWGGANWKLNTPIEIFFSKSMAPPGQRVAPSLPPGTLMTWSWSSLSHE